MSLQWGHRLSVVETYLQQETAKPTADLQWGHRLSVVETIYRRAVREKGGFRFNGATAFRWWKLGQGCVSVLRRRVASMGPPPFGGGND